MSRQRGGKDGASCEEEPVRTVANRMGSSFKGANSARYIARPGHRMVNVNDENVKQNVCAP